MNNFIYCKKIKEIYGNNCNEFAVAEIEEATVYYFIPMLLGVSCIFYLKNNKNVLSELLFQIGYKSFLVATKVSNVYRKVKNFFVSSTSITDTNNKNKNTYTYDEVKVIKNGTRCASFETMKTFKDSHYLGNPTEYYDLDEDVDVEDSCSYSESDHSHSPSSLSSPSSSCCSTSEKSSLEPLYIIESSDNNETVEFKNFDFIMHTIYKYPESKETFKQNYTKIYRTFTNDDYDTDKKNYELSKCEMILCTLQFDNGNNDDNNEDHKEYEIDIQGPYNFNVVGNLILDEKFVQWYMYKHYKYQMKNLKNYKITCISKDVKLFQLDRFCGLRVCLNDYQQVRQDIQ